MGDGDGLLPVLVAGAVELGNVQASASDGHVLVSADITNVSGETLPAGALMLGFMLDGFSDPQLRHHPGPAQSLEMTRRPTTEPLENGATMAWSQAEQLDAGMYKVTVTVKDAFGTGLVDSQPVTVVQYDGVLHESSEVGGEDLSGIKPEIQWVEHVGLSADGVTHEYRVHFLLYNTTQRDLPGDFEVILQARPSDGYIHASDSVWQTQRMQAQIPAGGTGPERCPCSSTSRAWSADLPRPRAGTTRGGRDVDLPAVMDIGGTRLQSAHPSRSARRLRARARPWCRFRRPLSGDRTRPSSPSRGSRGRRR